MESEKNLNSENRIVLAGPRDGEDGEIGLSFQLSDKFWGANVQHGV